MLGEDFFGLIPASHTSRWSETRRRHPQSLGVSFKPLVRDQTAAPISLGVRLQIDLETPPDA